MSSVGFEGVRVFVRLSGRILAAVAAGAVAASAITFAPIAAAPAEASVADSFNPGQIITDNLFYDGNAWDVSQVQNFLNQRLAATSDGGCTIGRPGRAAGSTWGSTKIAERCLRTMRFNTVTRPANAYCKGYAGRTGETAASIITRVGRACGISQKVLLVMLEKEQSLITDTWPSVRQYDFAMGWNCPDSGPGGSAQCDPYSKGFGSQVYKSAWQYKVYRARPDSYNYKPFQYNTIQYHPNRGCGTSNVYIRNWATAALYIYTPYRPNQAALNAGWGTGNSCSSYGNRNFHNFYTTWFGSTQGTNSLAERRVYDAYLKYKDQLGTPIDSWPQVVTRNGGGAQMRFSDGVVTYSNKIGYTYALYGNNAWVDTYRDLGGANSAWGFLSTTRLTGSLDAGTKQLRTQNGVAVYDGNKVWLIPTRVYNVWVKYGRHTGAIGFPIQDAKIYAGTDIRQRFRGRIIFTTPTSAIMTTRAQYVEWNGLGGWGKVGFYTSPRSNAGETQFQYSQRGMVAWVDAKPVVVSDAKFVSAYRKAGGPNGSWGTLLRAPQRYSNGQSVAFLSNGQAVWSSRSGVRFYKGGTTSAWGPYAINKVKRAATKYASQLGRALQSRPALVTRNGGGAQMYFENGVVTYSNASNMTYATIGRNIFLSTYRANGGANSSWGFLTTSRHSGSISGGTLQLEFQNGVAVYDGRRAWLVDPKIYDVWVNNGRHSGGMGYPRGNPKRYSSTSTLQGFENSVVFTTKNTATVVTRAQYSEWWAAGGWNKLGFYTSELRTVGSAKYRNTQRGLITFVGSKKYFVSDATFLSAYRAAGGPEGSWGTVRANPATLSDGKNVVYLTKGQAVWNKGGRVTFYKSGSASTGSD